MKRFFIISQVLFVTMVVTAQDFTYNHDDYVMNAVLVEETGVGDVGCGNFLAKLNYSIWNPGYRDEANAMGKSLQRTLVMNMLKQEQQHAAAIDSAFTKRAVVAAKDYGDRSIDAIWVLEGDKINRALQKWEENINLITVNGGTMFDYREWNNALNGTKAAIEGVKNAHLANSQRHECYTLIYKDIEEKNLTLVAYLQGWLDKKETDELLKGSGTCVRSVSRSDVTRVCFARWKAALIQGSRLKK